MSSSTSGVPPATGTQQPSSGLSPGAKAGIGVGAAIGVLALGALIVFMFARRKRKHTADGGEQMSNLRNENKAPIAIYELDSRRERGTSELDGRGLPVEIDSSHNMD